MNCFIEGLHNYEVFRYCLNRFSANNVNDGLRDVISAFVHYLQCVGLGILCVEHEW